MASTTTSNIEPNTSSSQSVQVEVEKQDELTTPPNQSDEESAQPSAPETFWDGPDDHDNPRNWTFGSKFFHTLIPALSCFVLAVGTSAYVPAIPYIMVQFGVSREIAVLPLTMYTVGFGLGPMFASPLSEMYGRRIVYWVTMLLLLIFTAGAGVSNNITTLSILRLLAGTGGSGALGIGAGTIADIWDPKHRGPAALAFVLAPFLGPALGPLIGAYVIAEYDNWRFSMWVVLIIAAPIASASLFMKETSQSRILYLREKKRGLKTVHDAGDTHVLVGKLTNALITPLHMMFIEPLVSLLSLYTGFAFAMLFSFFASYNYVFQVVYQFSQKQIGLAFIGILIGFLIGVITFAICDKRIYAKEFAKANGTPAPEHRLYASLLGSVLLPVSLFWFAWTPWAGVHWIVPVLAGIPFGWAGLTIFISAATYLIDVYQAQSGASALAANGLLRYILGAAFPLFTIQMYDAMGVHWAGSVFAFVALVLMPVPWVFFFKGKGLRARSHYNTIKY